MQTLELNKALRTGRLLKLHFTKNQGQAIVQPDDNGIWNHRAVRKAIYDNMPNNWFRYTIRHMTIENYTTVIISFKREYDENALCEAWSYYLGDVISSPPVRDF